VSRAALFACVCGAAALVCFIALVILSKGWLEPEGLAIFDSRVFGYSPLEARAYLDAISVDQLHLYLDLYRKLDTVFPLLLAATLLGVIWLNTVWKGVIMRLAACLPVLVCLGFDLLENAGVAFLLTGWGPVIFENKPTAMFMTPFEVVVRRVSFLTQMKWAALAGSAIAVIWAVQSGPYRFVRAPR
jgi:hypothetical protein